MAKRVKNKKRIVASSPRVPVKGALVSSDAVRNPFVDEMRSMQSRMDALFDRFWDRDLFSSSLLSYSPFERRMLELPRLSNPVSNVWENAKEVGFDVELPGMDRKDIRLSISPDKIDVRAERQHEQKQEKKGFFRMERSFAGFSRSFALPRGTDVGKASAKYDNGVLRIRVPKRSDHSSSASRIVEIE